MKESQNKVGIGRPNQGLDKLERMFTGRIPEDPRRDKYPRKLQSLYFPTSPGKK